uniref:Putative secreted peptide n=1 Tax=Anopheles braziliensis TaxID=58242 RepID=A0A2M3ZRH3_9DIPT
MFICSFCSLTPSGLSLVAAQNKEGAGRIVNRPSPFPSSAMFCAFACPSLPRNRKKMSLNIIIPSSSL